MRVGLSKAALVRGNNVRVVSFFYIGFMVKVDSQVCVRVNSQGVRVTSQPVRVTSQPVRVISKHCTSCRLCGVPQHPLSKTKLLSCFFRNNTLIVLFFHILIEFVHDL